MRKFTLLPSLSLIFSSNVFSNGVIFDQEVVLPPKRTAMCLFADGGIDAAELVEATGNEEVRIFSSSFFFRIFVRVGQSRSVFFFMPYCWKTSSCLQATSVVLLDGCLCVCAAGHCRLYGCLGQCTCSALVG